MENASKALIIAGAILLSILIIALGIYVFNMAKGATDTNQLDTLEISTFNDQFLNYEGRQIGSSVKQLISNVINSNNTNIESQERLIQITYNKGTGTYNSMNLGNGYNLTVGKTNSYADAYSALRTAIAASHYYTVTFGYQASGSGYINSVTIDY